MTFLSFWLDKNPDDPITRKGMEEFGSLCHTDSGKYSKQMA